MTQVWRITALLSVGAIGAAVFRERVDDAALLTGLAIAAIVLVTILTVALHVLHHRTAQRRFGGTNRFRGHLLLVGDLAVIMLALQFWVAGLALAAATAALFTHDVDKATAHARLQGELTDPLCS